MVERLLVRSSLVAISMTSNDGMELNALEIKTWVLCQYIDGRLKNPHAI